MILRSSCAWLFLLSLAAAANTQTWTSPDGFLSVTPPDATQFQAVPSPPLPFVALWVSNDESTQIGVMMLPIPADIKLSQSSVEEGLSQEIDGSVTRLPTKKVSGHEVWHMVGANGPLEIRQAILRPAGVLYKLMAVTTGEKPDAALIDQFMDSMSIVKPAALTPSGDAGKLSGSIDMHKLSKTIGGAGALLGIGLVIYLLTRGKKPRPA